MLFRILLLRMCPIILLKFCKNRRSLKIGVAAILIVYIIAGVVTLFYLWKIERWKILWLVPAAMFPQYVCYLFVIWCLLRCAWSPWSSRVWNRIFCLSVVIVSIGVYLEYTINPMILSVIGKI